MVSPGVVGGSPRCRWWCWWWWCCRPVSAGSSENLAAKRSSFQLTLTNDWRRQRHRIASHSPLLWPSQSSCRKRKRSQVNSSSDITFSSREEPEGRKGSLPSTSESPTTAAGEVDCLSVHSANRMIRSLFRNLPSAPNGFLVKTHGKYPPLLLWQTGI